MKRIGIFGGAFDPPHIGHIHAIQEAKRNLRLDEVLLIPSNLAPHKQNDGYSASAEQRLQMLRIAAENIPGFVVSDIEIQRGGLSFSCETVKAVRKLYPKAELYLILGSDALRSFPNWKEYEYITKNTKLAVLRRGDKKESDIIKEMSGSLKAKIADVKNEAQTISSTQLKRLLAFRCGDTFLPEGVGAYIKAQGLYDSAADWNALPMEKLESIVIRLLNPNRVQHVLGCRDTAVELARRWNVDETDAARAGILHDITKALDGPLQLTLCEAYGKILDDFSRKYPKTLHALTGSLVAERIFGENEAVVSSICSHTTGKADMSILEAIIYVADYMEPNRSFPGVEELRRLAFTDIYAALRLGLEMTLEHLKDQGNEVSPMSRDALNYLNTHTL